ncbi:MAG: hypothetical protein J2O46_07285 [Nocardioides sp.]|nr:hypothetical protein [Nocardioides sp.]
MWGRTKGLYAGMLLILVALVSAGCAAGPRLGGEEAEASPTVPSSTHPYRSPQDATSQRVTPTPAPVPGQPELSVPVLPSAVDHGIVEGADVSWPNCPKGMGIKQRPSEGQPMPLPSAQFAVLGLTNGPAFHPNPCLASQVAWVKQRHLRAAAYSVISYPTAATEVDHGAAGPGDPSTHVGRLTNVGYGQAKYNLDTMQDAGLTTPTIWIDVEPVTIWEWSHDPAANAAVVKGAVQAYREAGYQVGVYSLGSMWKRIVGDLELGLPEWRPAGESSRAGALKRCTGKWMFQNGAAVLVQWVDGHRDRNVTCPGQSVYLQLWFHQY